MIWFLLLCNTGNELPVPPALVRRDQMALLYHALTAPNITGIDKAFGTFSVIG